MLQYNKFFGLPRILYLTHVLLSIYSIFQGSDVVEASSIAIAELTSVPVTMKMIINGITEIPLRIFTIAPASSVLKLMVMKSRNIISL